MPYRCLPEDPIVRKWTGLNPIYRQPKQIWRLPSDCDRDKVMRDVAVLGGDPSRPAPPARPHDPPWKRGDLPETVRHLVIDGYDLPLRRWALHRCQRGVNALYCAGGLLAAAALTSVFRTVFALNVPDVLAMLSVTEAIAAILVFLYAASRILPILTASTYPRQWIDHMPPDRAAHRYRRLYEPQTVAR